MRGNAYLARINFYILSILLINFVAILGQHDASAIIETLQMRAGDSDINASDHHVAFLFGIHDCFVNAFHRRLKINDFPLAHAA